MGRPDDAASLADEVDAWVRRTWDPELTVRAWWGLLADAGFAHPTWPAGLGGSARSAHEARVIARALGRHDVVAPPVGGVGSTLAAPTLLAHGAPEQVRALVAPIARGETAWCQLFSEPGSGSDLASLGARAIRDGDGWVVSGQKVWSSRADEADLGMLLARTDPAEPRHAGISYFVIDMHQPGVEVRPLRVMNGTSPFCEVFLDEARIPADRLVGEPGGGWRVAQTTLAAERAMVAGGGTPGLHPARSGRDGDLDRPVGEIVERSRAAARRRGPLRAGAVPTRVMIELARTHGRTDDPVVRQELARYWSQVKVDGWTMRRSAAAGGRLTGVDGSLAKLATANICQQSAALASRIAGAVLLLDGPDSPFGGDLQRVNLGAPGNRIGGGTDEIQRNVIGERGLGLPR